MYDFFAERYGFGPWDMARMTISEAKMYVNGAEAREEKKQRNMQSGQSSGVSNSQRKREQEALEKYS